MNSSPNPYDEARSKIHDGVRLREPGNDAQNKQGSSIISVLKKLFQRSPKDSDDIIGAVRG